MGCREDRWHVSQSSFCWVLDPATLSSSWVLVIFATAGRGSVVCGSLLFLFSFCYWGLNLWPLACWYCCSAKLGSQNLTRGVLGRCALRLSHLDSPYSPPLKLCVDECFVCMCMFVHCVHAWYPWRLQDSIHSPETGVTCELPCRHWEMNLSPLEEQPELLTAKLPLWAICFL